jgi:mannosyltransferase OCH1-like enzyme
MSTSPPPDSNQPTGERIPRHLIHIVPSHAGLSQDMRQNLQRLALANPGWRQMVFSDEEAERFVHEHYEPRYARALSHIDPAYGPARSDLMRYLIMYQLGGVYLDTKSGLDRPLHNIVQPADEFIISQWQNGPDGRHPGVGMYPELMEVGGGEYQNWVIVSRPQHPFLQAVISQVVDNIERYSRQAFGVGKLGVLRLTGPIAYTQAIHPMLSQAPHRCVVCVEAGFVYAASGSTERHVLNDHLHYSRLSHPIIRPAETAGVLAKAGFLLQRLALMRLARFKHWNRRRLHARRAVAGGRGA